jgi:pimeloyl-ACP methyl ester carboxylesterase
MAGTEGTARGEAWRDLWVTLRDGLRLYGRHYPAPGSSLKPVVCLPGLTRNSRDFHDLGLALSQGETARSVYTLDLRGRGLSDHDSDWRNYAVPIEMLDVQEFLTMLDLDKPTILGTSRGGLIAMVLAAAQPNALGAVVLNDIGPVIDRDGLVRIKAYVGKVPVPSSWEDAARLVADMSRKAFPAVPEAQWAEVARQWFNDVNGKPAPSYDAKLERSFSLADGPVPELWPQFKALSGVPMLVIRGENSDILSATTVQQMRARHPQCASMTVAGQGHAPLLKDSASISAIAQFLADVDAGRPVAGRDLTAAA